MNGEEGLFAEVEAPSEVCMQCGSAGLQATMVRSAFWQGERLVVIEDIPAMVCQTCRERFYDDATVVMLDFKRGEGFRPEDAVAELRVPVFSLRAKAAPQEPD